MWLVAAPIFMKNCRARPKQRHVQNTLKNTSDNPARQLRNRLYIQPILHIGISALFSMARRLTNKSRSLIKAPRLFPKAAIRLKTMETGSCLKFLNDANKVPGRSRHRIKRQSQFNGLNGDRNF